MKLKLRAKIIDIDFAKKEVVLHCDDASELGVRAGSRVRLEKNGNAVTGIVNVTDKFVKRGEIGCFDDVSRALKLKKGEAVLASVVERPESLTYIKKKLAGGRLNKAEIEKIIADMVSGSMSDIEVAAFVCGLHTSGMDMDEVEVLTKTMAESGDRLEIEGKVFDKHSIGGVPGNKISPIIIPIVAAAGLKIPKTSSRAITSPAGTADVMEVLCPVCLDIEDIRDVVNKTNGCLVWGGAVDLAPADDMMIHVEYPLDLDPRALLLASVMSKKKAVGADYVVIDIPVGKETKVATIQEGEKLAQDFIELGKRLGMRVECAITYGDQPVGHAMGPALEAKEALETLMGRGPDSLIEKSCGLAGMLLEIGGIAAHGRGRAEAEHILESGEALRKFREILKAQGGKPGIRPADIKLGKFRKKIIASDEGYVAAISNHGIKKVSRAAGAPKDKGAGIYLHKKVGEKVEKGTPLFTIYADNKEKLKLAERTANALVPTKVESMLLEKIPSDIHHIR